MIQDLPFGEKSIELSSKEVITVPNVVCLMIPESIATQYQTMWSYAIKSQYIAENLICVFCLCPQVPARTRLHHCNGSVHTFLPPFLLISCLYAWGICCIPDHCRAYALSDPNNPEFQTKCSHKPLDICDCCDNLKTVLNNIDEAISQMPANNPDIIEELTFVTNQVKQAIHAWKAHLLRNVNQDEACTNALDILDERSVLVVQDWAMRFLPRKYRKSQTDWFGKRGISWHITVAIHRAELDQKFHTMIFVHAF